MKTSKKKVEMRGILPRYPEDIVDFITEKLGEIDPCTIAELTRHLGGESRVEGRPSPEYNKVQDALKRAAREGRAELAGGRGSWRVK